MRDEVWDDTPARDDGLGSLAQSARGAGLGQARGILYAVGVLNVVLHALALAFLEQLVGRADDETVRVARLLLAGWILVGVVFLALGAAVYRAPVACTVTGLVMYLALIAVNAVADPGSLVNPCLGVFRFLVIAGLAKAVQAAAAYEKQHRAEARQARRARDEGWDHSYE